MRISIFSRRALVALSGALALGLSLPSAAQTYPAKSVHIIVGFAPGGSTDKLARVLAQRMSELLGQTVVIENKPGAAGNIAAELVASAPADGYTIFLGTVSSQAINPHLYSTLRFDPLKSFEPIALVAKYPLLLVVAPQLQVTTVQELVSYARANPGKTFYASSGNGSPAHLAGEIFRAATRTDVRHVPYKGGGPAMMAMMGNEVQFGFETIPSAIGHSRSGKLKGIAVTSGSRSPAAPELPTMLEAGVKGFPVTSWAGLLAPAGTPKDVLAKLTQATQSALASPALVAALSGDGAEAGTGSPADFARFMADELKAWGEVVRNAGTKLE